MDEKRRAALQWGGTILLLGVVLALLWRSGFFEAVSSQKNLEAFISRWAPWSHLAFFGVQLLSVVFAPVPSNVTAAAGAVLFGMWPAFLLTWGAVVSGSALVFGLARMLGQRFVETFVSPRLSGRYLEVIRRKRDVFLLLAFLFPFFPDDLLCIVAGVTDLPFRRFLLLVLLARPWGLLVACGVGGSVLDVPLWGMALLGAAGIALFVLAMVYGDRLEELLLKRMKK